MKNIGQKAIVTGNELEKAGYKHLTDTHGMAIFGKGYERLLYQRLEGKSERYKFIRKYESCVRDVKNDI